MSRAASGKRDNLDFGADDFTDVQSLADKLKDKTNLLSEYLYNKLEPATRDLLDASPLQVQDVLDPLCKDFNAFLNDKNLYLEARFESVTLRDETKTLSLKKDSTRASLRRLNRLLLEDAYPGEIREIQEIQHLTSEKKAMILKIIEIRLEGIGEALKRTKYTFILSIIVSCAMLMTVFSSYFSYTRKRAFDDNFKYKATQVRDVNLFLDYKDITGVPEVKANLGEKKKLLDLKKKLLAVYFFNDFNCNSDLTKPPYFKESTEYILAVINNNVLIDEWLFADDKITPEEFAAMFSDDKKKVDKNKIKSKFFDDKSESFTSCLSQRSLSCFFSDRAKSYYDATNHLNKLIIQKVFPGIEWEYVSSEPGASGKPGVSLYDENRRALSREWIESQNIRIGLLGIVINVDQFSLIGSLALMVISIWMLFSFRRENRSIVSLLRYVKEEVKRPKEGPGGKDESDEWDIANLTHHGIVHKLIFSQTGKDDKPMFAGDFTKSGQVTNIDWMLNGFVVVWTKFARIIAYVLLLLPVITIALILVIDFYTTTETLFPYSNNPVEYFINRNKKDNSDINNEILLGAVFGAITLLFCSACLIFQLRTVEALRTFEEHLQGETKKNRWHTLISIGAVILCSIGIFSLLWAIYSIAAVILYSIGILSLLLAIYKLMNTKRD